MHSLFFSVLRQATFIDRKWFLMAVPKKDGSLINSILFRNEQRGRKIAAREKATVLYFGNTPLRRAPCVSLMTLLVTPQTPATKNELLATVASGLSVEYDTT